MNQYTPKKLVAISRYQNFFPTLDESVRRDVYARIAELIEEEKEYCDKGNYKHMAQIVTSIALYEILQRHGKSEEEAYKIVSEEMWAFLDPSGMQKLAGKSFFMPLMKKSFLSDSEKAPASAGGIPGIKMTRRTDFILSAMNAFTRRFSAKEI